MFIQQKDDYMPQNRFGNNRKKSYTPYNSVCGVQFNEGDETDELFTFSSCLVTSNFRE